MGDIKLPSAPTGLGRLVREYGSRCWALGAEAAAQEQAGLLGLLADIREAAGDPEGRLMQTELVDRIRQLAGGPDLDIEAASKSAAQKFLPAPRKLWGTAYDVERQLAIYTESDVLRCLELAYRSGRIAGRKDDVAALRAADDRKISEEEERWADWRRGAAQKPGSKP